MAEVLAIARREFTATASSPVFALSVALPFFFPFLLGPVLVLALGRLGPAPEASVSQPEPALRLGLALAAMLLAGMASLMGGSWLLGSTLEEKSSRLVEVLLGAVDPLELMAGKVLGQGFAAGFVVASYGASAMAALALLGAAQLIGAREIGLFLLYFGMAHFGAAALMAAIGAAVNDLRDAQALLAPVTLLLLAPQLVALAWIGDPEQRAAQVASFVPLLTPYLMIFRTFASDAVPTWQIVLTSVLGYGAVLVLIALAAKVLRASVLLQGKRASLREILRAARA